MYSYSDQFEPPAPVLFIDISSPAQFSPVTVLAFLDTGSDITVVPRSVAQNLSLRPAYVGYVLGIGGVPEANTIFSALVSVEKEEPKIIEVLTWEEDYVLLGRDVINHWRLSLDGPEQVLTISRPRLSL